MVPGGDERKGLTILVEVNAGGTDVMDVILYEQNPVTEWHILKPGERMDAGGNTPGWTEIPRRLLVQGGGNWSSLAPADTKSRLAPGAIALDFVRITNGTIAIFNMLGQERTRFEHVNGEFSAQAIDGPYRLAAAYSQGGTTREVRLATAKPDADG